MKLERTEWIWKGPSEVGKNQPQLENFFSLKLESFAAVGKFWLTLQSLNELGKLSVTCHWSLKVSLRHELSNFNLSNFILDFPTKNFSTSRSFQLPFPTTRIPKILLFQPGKLENTRYRYQENPNSCFGLTHYWELKQVQLKKDELDVEHALD